MMFSSGYFSAYAPRCRATSAPPVCIFTSEVRLAICSISSYILGSPVPQAE